MAGALTAAIAAAFAGGVTPDPYFEYTTLLLPGSGTNGAQNNTFLDGSTNNFTITRNGNTTQGTFSPFSQTGWGNYFDGTGDYLSVADNAALELGSGDFCIEGWVYLTANSGSGIAFAAKNGGSFASWQIQANSTNWVYYLSSNGSTWNVSSSVTMGAASLNTWTHIALVRNSGVITPYINGVAGTTTTSSATIFNNSRDLTIGTVEGSAGSFSQYLTGYVSNFRLVVGSPVYTAAFTPPTSPLTAITNTALLTCQSNRFIDNSTNNFTITRNGDTSVVAFSPFNPTASWSAATNGGSGYFDGSGDYLTLGGQSAFVFGTGDFTIEMFAYVTNTANTIFDLRPSTPSGAYITIYVTGGVIYYYANGANQINGGTLPLNQWVHIVASRVSSNTRLFINGVQAGLTYSDTTNYTTSGSRPIIGADGNVTGSSPMIGYLSNLRVVKGSGVTSVTVPTAPLTAITNTSLLLNFTNAGIYDATSKNDLETVADAQISNTTAKFGSTSIKFDGTGDYLKGNQATTDLYTFSGDFTIETWVYSTSSAIVGGGYPTIFATSAFNGTGIGLKIQSAGGSGTTGCACVWYNNTQILTGTSNIADSAWHHVAVTRSGSTIRLFVDGTQQTSATNSSTFTCASGYPLTAADSSSAGNLTGYIQDLRITKGYARYTANFTAPTAAFPTL